MFAKVVLPFINAGVVQVSPLVDTEYTGYPLISLPTATKTPGEVSSFTVTDCMSVLNPPLPIVAGVLHVAPPV